MNRLLLVLVFSLAITAGEKLPVTHPELYLETKKKSYSYNQRVRIMMAASNKIVDNFVIRFNINETKLYPTLPFVRQDFLTSDWDENSSDLYKAAQSIYKRLRNVDRFLKAQENISDDSDNYTFEFENRKPSQNKKIVETKCPQSSLERWRKTFHRN